MTVGALLWQGLFKLVLAAVAVWAALKFLPKGATAILSSALLLVFVVMFVNGNLIPYDYGVLFQGSYSKAGGIMPTGGRLIFEALVLVMLLLTANRAVRFVERNIRFARVVLVLLVLSFVVRTCYAIMRMQKVPTQDVAESGSDVKLFRFSRTGKNVIYLLLDSFVGQRFGPLLDSDPALKKVYDGFTWYPATISASWFTFPDVPAMWAGEEYFPWRLGRTRKLGEVFDEAWNAYQENVHLKGYRFATSSMAQGYGCKIQDAERTYHEMKYKSGRANESMQKSVNLESLKGNALLHAVPLAFRMGIYDSGRWRMKQKTTAFDATFDFMADLVKNSTVIDDPKGVYIHVHNESTHYPYYSPVNGALEVCGGTS